MMIFDERWYSCELTDSSVPDEPDWSKVPEDKRERVRASWLTRQKPVIETVNLWGPQIMFFANLPYYNVKLHEAI